MKIWKDEHSGETNFQLKDMESGEMLINFTIESESEKELIEHMIKNLSDYLSKL